jgi:allophanate hydrolase
MNAQGIALGISGPLMSLLCGFQHQHIPDPDFTCLSFAGGIMVGKTNMDQFAAGLVGTRSPYGVPRNAFDSRFVPGGSSSGSGALVGAGVLPFALGTDTAGSGE